MIERILLACDGRGAWTAAVAVADLIVCSTEPFPRLRHAFTGSDSQAVIMRAGCPVMVVREPGFRV